MAHPAFGRLEDSVARAVRRELALARARMTDLLLSGRRPDGTKASEYDTGLAVQKRAAIDSSLADMERNVVRELEAAIEKGAQLSAESVAKAQGWGVGVDPGVVAYAKATAADQVKTWTAGIQSRVRALTTRTIAGGMSWPEFQREIGAAMGSEATAGRIDRIARTEVARAYQQGRAAADEEAADLGVDLIRRWVSQRDERVRDTHLAIDGQEREMWQLFNVGLGASDATPPSSRAGYKANGPLDPTLPPEEAINCRCDVIYVERAEAKQGYVSETPPRRRPTGGSSSGAGRRRSGR